MVNSGQLRTFLPVTYLSKTDLTVLRPLLYYREAEIIDIINKLNFSPLKNPCPFDGYTNRQTIKEHLKTLTAINPEAYEHLAAAMRSTLNQELWPRSLTQKELSDKFHIFKMCKH